MEVVLVAPQIYYDPQVSAGGNESASRTFRTIFVAQLMKDIAMAHFINRLIDGERQLLKSGASLNNRYLVIAGKGHTQHNYGVPERVVDALGGVCGSDGILLMALRKLWCEKWKGRLDS